METIAYLKTQVGSAKEKGLKPVMELMNAKGVRVSYDKEKELLLFYNMAHKRYTPDEHCDITAECNGLILDFDFNPVLVPRRFPVNLVANDVLGGLLKTHKAYAIYDGTIINLYHREGKWRLSTSKGIEVNKIVHRGGTFEALFMEALAAAGEPDLLEKLDTQATYTFGFSHFKLHPFYPVHSANSKNPPVWFVQKVVCDAKGYTVYKELEEASAIPKQAAIDLSKGVGSLRRKLESAFDRYKKTGEVFFGVILEGPESGEYNEYGAVLLESTLMKKVRKIFYDQKRVEMAKASGEGLIQFLELFALLESSDTYLGLMPHRLPVWGAYQQAIQRLEREVLNACTGKKKSDVVGFFAGHVLRNIDSKSAQAIQTFTHSMLWKPQNTELLLHAIRDL
jgi:hypothetical protein